MLVHQMDVVTTFLNGNLDEEIYMQQPEGYIKPGEKHLVCKLEKSLYGLKQAPRCWNKAFGEYIKNIGFVQSSGDACVHIKRQETLTIIAVYVDDLILLAENTIEMLKIKDDLSKKFLLKDMGELHYCLGITIIQDKKNKQIFLNQHQYIKKILQRFGQTEAKVVTTPADMSVKLVKQDGVSKSVDSTYYQSIIGSLLYVAIATRPDISQAVRVLSKFCASPTEAHLTAAKRVLRYLKGTENLSLRFKKSVSETFIGYSDADWAGDLDDRHSTSGNLFILANGTISWMSKKQATVALSTAESEYVALSQATQEAIWLRRLLKDLGMFIDQPTVIHEDNKGAISIARNPVFHGRTKHIDIRSLFIRASIQLGAIDVKYFPSI